MSHLAISSSLLFSFFLLIIGSLHAAAPRKLVLVPTPPTVLAYHQGPLLAGPSPLNVYFLWYGTFTPAQKAVLADFVSSFSYLPTPAAPSVASWWSTASAYTDAAKRHVSSSIRLASQASIPASPQAAVLKKADIKALVLQSLSSKTLPLDERGVYYVLTADEVGVEDFCMSSCGFHDSLTTGKGVKLPYAWVGNAGKQCAGYCAWPFAAPEVGGPSTWQPLRAPSGDVGMEGMVINVAATLAGAATNPFGTGYYQGAAGAPLEAASACTGIFGQGAYPGNPGALFTDARTKASFNARGIKGRLFLLPALWSPSSRSCTPLS